LQTLLQAVNAAAKDGVDHFYASLPQLGATITRCSVVLRAFAGTQAHAEVFVQLCEMLVPLLIYSVSSSLPGGKEMFGQLDDLSSSMMEFCLTIFESVLAQVQKKSERKKAGVFVLLLLSHTLANCVVR